MSSSVFFKFKSQKEPSRVTFDGTGISVFELKRQIIQINRLGDGSDFDLAIYNQDTNEEYDDDTAIIPRSTSIIARRLPPPKPGKGTAQRYVHGKMPTHALPNAGRREKNFGSTTQPVKKEEAIAAAPAAPTGDSEEDMIAAMLDANTEQWNKTQEQLATATYVHRGGAQFKKNQAPAPSHPPPAGYVCYRCGEKGHWIQQCPTNNDPSFDGRPRVKRTTGIPRSFLKTVEKPTHIPGADDGSNGQNPTSIMVNAEGEYVVAMPDQSSWEKYQQKAASGNQKQNDDPAGLEELKSLGIDCKICKKVLNDAVKTPCCGTHYCEECIQNTLLESDFVCPNCDAKEQPLEGLVADTEAREKVQKFRDDKEKPQQSLPPTSSTAPTAPPTGTVPSTTPATNIPAPEKTPTTSSATLNAPPGPRSNSTTPNPSSTPSSVPSGPNPKKRSAESDLGPEVPRGPAAMRNAVPPNSTNNPPKFSPNNNVAIPSFPAGPAVNNNPNSYNNFSNGPNNNFGVGGFDNFGFGVMPGMPGMGMMMGMSGFNGFNNGFNAQGGAYSGAQNGYNNFGGASNNGYMNSGAGWNNQGYPAGGQNGYNAMGGGMNGMNPMMGGYGGGYGMGGMNMGMGGMGIQGAGMNGMMGPGMGGVEGEDSPYMRKPVNPHRHTRPKRPRPSDFKAVGGEM